MACIDRHWEIAELKMKLNFSDWSMSRHRTLSYQALLRQWLSSSLDQLRSYGGMAGALRSVSDQ